MFIVQVNGKGKFRPPQLRNRSTDVDEIRTLELPPKTTHNAIFHFNPMTWVVSANTQFLVSFSFFFGLFVKHTGRTGWPILTIYTSYDVFPPSDVPFGDSVDMPPHLVGKIPPKR